VHGTRVGSRKFLVVFGLVALVVVGLAVNLVGSQQPVKDQVSKGVRNLAVGAYGTDDDTRANLVEVARQRARRPTASTSTTAQPS
jgi:hypothetical protein